MSLYKIFSYNVEVQYKSPFMSKAMLFTVITTVLALVLPFFIASKSNGFWLRSHFFYEQPLVHFTYEYLLVAESDDPSRPIVCKGIDSLYSNTLENEEYCAEFQVQEHDYNGDGKNDIIEFKIYLNIPPKRTITSLALILELDFKFKTICPMHMQSLVVINKEFVLPVSALKYFGDLTFYQTTHLTCKQNVVDNRYNSSAIDFIKKRNDNVIDIVLENYFMRQVTSHIKTIYSRSQNGHTGSMILEVNLRVPEMKIRYIPSLMQELKSAWPQYISLFIIFYWIFNKIKIFVFTRRLVMVWELLPWKKLN